MAKRMTKLDLIALILVTVGAVNWGLVAFGFNLVEFIVFGIEILAKIIYGLVGLAGLYSLYFLDDFCEAAD